MEYLCTVVYLYIPTPNHNRVLIMIFSKIVVYLYIPTPNHNCPTRSTTSRKVVYLYIPTPNHNNPALIICSKSLYIFIFLHQTTTSKIHAAHIIRCISLYSYTKPQLKEAIAGKRKVVYLYIPTPNHNKEIDCAVTKQLYIFIFLHQTTTALKNAFCCWRCISLYSYTKPQPKETNILIIR